MIFFFQEHFYKSFNHYASILIYSVKYPQLCDPLKFFFKTCNCSQPCFQIRKYGRFGNQIVTFLRSVQLAKKIGVSLIFFYPGFIMQTQSFIYKDIFFNVSTSKIFKYHYLGKCFYHDFYFPIPKLPRLFYDIDDSFRYLFRKYLHNMSIPDDTLVIHLRSGDVFYQKVPSLLGQPPCNYYRDVIHSKNWSKVIILSETNGNPCVNILCQEIGKKFEPHDLKTDLSILLNAPNLVLSKGTFGFAIIALSVKLKNIYMFNVSSSRIPNHFNCIPTDNYYLSILKDWKNTISQKKMMISSHCEKWEFITKGDPQNLEIFMHENIF